MAEYGIKIKPVFTDDQGERGQFIDSLNKFLKGISESTQFVINDIGLTNNAKQSLAKQIEEALKTAAPTITIGKIDTDKAVKGADFSALAKSLAGLKVSDNSFETLNGTLAEIKESLNSISALVREFGEGGKSSSAAYISSLEKINELLDKISQKDFTQTTVVNMKQAASATSTSMKEYKALREYIDALSESLTGMYSIFSRYSNTLSNPFKGLLDKGDLDAISGSIGAVMNVQLNPKLVDTAEKAQSFATTFEGAIAKLSAAFVEARKINPDIPVPDLAKIEKMKEALDAIRGGNANANGSTVSGRAVFDSTAGNDVLNNLGQITTELGKIRELFISTFDMSTVPFEIEPILEKLQDLETRFGNIAINIEKANKAAEKSLTPEQKSTLTSQSSVLKTMSSAVENNMSGLLKNGGGSDSVGAIVNQYQQWVAAVQNVITAHHILSQEEMDALTKQGLAIQQAIAGINEEIAATEAATKAQQKQEEQEAKIEAQRQAALAKEETRNDILRQRADAVKQSDDAEQDSLEAKIAATTRYLNLLKSITNFVSQNPNMLETNVAAGDGEVSLKSIFEDISNYDAANASVQDLTESILVWKEALASAQQQLASNTGTDKFNNNADTINAKIQTLIANIRTFIENTPQLSQGSVDSLNGIIEGLQNIDTSNLNPANESLRKFTAQFQQIKAEAPPAIKETKSAFDELKEAMFRGQVGAQGFVAAIRKMVGEIKQLFTYVKTLDAAMVELEKVTDLTSKGYEDFYKVAVKTAETTGSSVSQTINAAADFSRLGFNIGDAEELARVALMYKNVGDGITDVSQSTEAIIATMKAFGMEAENAIDIVDKFNETGNNFAISSYGVGEALQRSAAALSAAGNSLEESIGLIVAANNVVQNTVVVGTTMKTISMYLRAAKTELEAAGEDTDGMAESVSKLREEMLALTGVDIVMEDNETFKSTYEILKEISSVWDQLSDLTQANVTNLLGGKRNANVISAIMTNFKDAEAAMKRAMDATGSAEKENAKYIDSITGKLDILQGKVENFANTVLNSDAMKTLLDAAGGLIDLANGLVSFESPVGALVSTVAALLSVFMKMPAIIGVSNGQLMLLGASFDTIKSKGLSAAISMTGFGKSITTMLSTAGTALANAGIISLIATIINWSIKGIEYIAKWKDRIYEAAESANAVVDNAESAVSEFLTLNSSLSDGSIINAEYAESIGGIATSLDDTGMSVDALIRKFGDLDKAVIQSGYNKIIDSEGDIRKGYATSSRDMLNAIKPGTMYGSITSKKVKDEYLDRVTTMFDEVFAESQIDFFDYIVQSSDDAREIMLKRLHPETSRDAIEVYNAYSEILRMMNEEFGYDSKGNSIARDVFGPVYDEVSRLVSSSKEVVEKFRDDAKELNDLTINKAVYSELVNGGVPKTQSDIAAFYSGIAKSLTESGQIVNTETGAIIDDYDLVMSMLESMYGKIYTPYDKINSDDSPVPSPEDYDVSFDEIESAVKKTIDVLKQLSDGESSGLNRTASDNNALIDTLDEIGDTLHIEASKFWYTINESGDVVFDAAKIYEDVRNKLYGINENTQVFDGKQGRLTLFANMLSDIDGYTEDLRESTKNVGSAVDELLAIMDNVANGTYNNDQKSLYEDLLNASSILGVDMSEITESMDGGIGVSLDTLRTYLLKYIDASVSAGKVTYEYGEICKSAANGVDYLADSYDDTIKAITDVVSALDDIGNDDSKEDFGLVEKLNSIANAIGKEANGVWYELENVIDDGGEIIGQRVKTFFVDKIISDAIEAADTVIGSVEDDETKSVLGLLKTVLIGASGNFDENGELVKTEEDVREEIDRVRGVIDDATSLIGTLSGKDVDDVSAYEKLVEIASSLGLSIEDLASVTGGNVTYNIESLRSSLIGYIENAVKAGYVTDEFGQILIKAANNAGTTAAEIETLADKESRLNSLFSQGYDVGRNTEITYKEFEELIKINSSYADTIEYVNGKLVINRDKYNEVTNRVLQTDLAQIKAQKSALLLGDEYQSLVKSGDRLTGKQKMRKAQIEAEARAYDVLASELENATSAYTRFMNSSDDDSNGRYAQAVKALGVITDTIENVKSDIFGKVGRDQFKLAVDFVLGENVEVDTDKFNDGLKIVKRYLTEDAKGVTNFYNDMIANGLIDGITGDMDTTISEISQKLGISAEAARAMMEELERYNKTPFNWEKLDSSGEIEETKSATQLAIEELQTFQSIEQEINDTDIEVDTSDAVKNIETMNSTLGETLQKIRELASIGIGGAIAGLVSRLFGKSAAAGGIVGGKTLVGELGPEIVVDPDGHKWHTVGENGPEIVNLKHGSIVLNAEQTEKILKGKSGSGQAMALGGTIGSVLVGNAKRTAMLKDFMELEDELATQAKIAEENMRNLANATQNISSEIKNSGVSGNVKVNLPGLAAKTGSGGGSSKAEDLAESLKKKYEELNDVLEHLIEHQEFLYKVADRGLDYNGMEASLQEQARLYKQIMDNSYAAVAEMQKQGLTDSDKALQDMERAAWSAYESMYDAFDKIRALYTDALQEKIDDIQKGYDDIRDIIKGIDENGSVSVDAFQELAEHGIEYLSFLENIDGQYKLNEDGVRDLIAAEKEQLAVESAMSYISRIREALANGEGNELAKLVDVTQQIGDSTWDAVYAQAALLKNLGIAQDDYDQIILNINAFRDIAGKVSMGEDDISESLDEQENAIDKILEYTKDLVKTEVQDRIKVIEDEVKAFRDIVDAKKKSLELTKEENSYEKSVADKVKEIANLQSRIDQLSLDTSREARAERASMVAELAELQGELAEYQAEHAYDAQIEQLDKTADAYEEERQKEIDVLEESISSEEKIYRLAIERIANEWDTLYVDLINKNYEQGNMINQEITDNWKLATEAVKEYGSYLAALQNLRGLDINEVNEMMPISAAPKYHSGGVVGDAGSINDEEVVAVLKKGEIVANEEMKNGLYRIIDFQKSLVEKLSGAVRNFGGIGGMFGSMPELAGAVSGVNASSNAVFSPNISVVINHNGDMDDGTARSYGERIADTAIDRLYSAFERKGMTGLIGGKMKQ